MEIDKKAQAAIEMIQIQLNELTDIVSRVREGVDSTRENLKRWKSRTVKLLSDKVNPEEGTKLREITRNFVTADHVHDIVYDANQYRAFLSSLNEELKKHPEGVIPTETEKSPAVLVEENPKLFGSRTVFIVHGRDEAAKQSVARFLERLDLEVVILHEQPDKGRTLVEKLEASSSEVDVAYAIVILTPDDVGALTSEKDKLQPRARQNVVFELGYFIARLGRQRVRAMYTEGVELPSDYQGVLYTQLDRPGAWRLELAREIKAAGITVDLNKIA